MKSVLWIEYIMLHSHIDRLYTVHIIDLYQVMVLSSSTFLLHFNRFTISFTVFFINVLVVPHYAFTQHIINTFCLNILYTLSTKMLFVVLRKKFFFMFQAKDLKKFLIICSGIIKRKNSNKTFHHFTNISNVQPIRMGVTEM